MFPSAASKCCKDVLRGSNTSKNDIVQVESVCEDDRENSQPYNCFFQCRRKCLACFKACGGSER